MFFSVSRDLNKSSVREVLVPEKSTQKNLKSSLKLSEILGIKCVAWVGKRCI